MHASLTFDRIDASCASAALPQCGTLQFAGLIRTAQWQFTAPAETPMKPIVFVHSNGRSGTDYLRNMTKALYPKDVEVWHERLGPGAGARQFFRRYDATSLQCARGDLTIRGMLVAMAESSATIPYFDTGCSFHSLFPLSAPGIRRPPAHRLSSAAPVRRGRVAIRVGGVSRVRGASCLGRQGLSAVWRQQLSARQPLGAPNAVRESPLAVVGARPVLGGTENPLPRRVDALRQGRGRLRRSRAHADLLAPAWRAVSIARGRDGGRQRPGATKCATSAGMVWRRIRMAAIFRIRGSDGARQPL